MKTILIALFAIGGYCAAADSGDALEEPQTLLKVVTAVEKSGIDELTSKKDEQGTSYHMRRIDLVGTITRDKRVYSIAHAVFVRSSPPGRDTPPARGHDFIIALDDGFKIVGVGRTGFGSYRMQGDKLYFGENKEPCADFGSTDPAIRHGGYFEIGLPYPFPDRISDEEWDSGSFRSKE